MGYNSVSVKDICEIFASMGGFTNGSSNDANQIFLQANPVVLATKFGMKWTAVRDICEIFASIVKKKKFIWLKQKYN